MPFEADSKGEFDDVHLIFDARRRLIRKSKLCTFEASPANPHATCHEEEINGQAQVI